MIKISQNIKQILFATIITLGLMLIVNAKNSANDSVLIPAILTSTGILIVQVYIIYRRAKQKLENLQIPLVHRYKNSLELFYHFILPIIFFVDLCLFIYFNTVYLLIPLLLFFCFIIFLILFINIRAYFEDKFKIEIATHFVYYFIINFTVFSLCLSILSISYSYDLPIILTGIIIGGMSSLMLYLNHIEASQLNLKLFGGILAYGLLNMIMALVLFQEFNSILRTSFIIASCFYFLNALLTHKKEGTFGMAIILEYLTILALGFVVLFGINQ